MALMIPVICDQHFLHTIFNIFSYKKLILLKNNNGQYNLVILRANLSPIHRKKLAFRRKRGPTIWPDDHDKTATAKVERKAINNRR